MPRKYFDVLQLIRARRALVQEKHPMATRIKHVVVHVDELEDEACENLESVESLECETISSDTVRPRRYPLAEVN